MPSSCPSEERFPLLLLFLEDGQRTSKHNRRILIDKNRYQGIASGATAVLTQWPGHLTTCWLTATLIGVTIIVLSMLMFAISVHPGIHLLTARCRSNHLYGKTDQNVTIHLVHGPGLWIQSQLETLQQIAENYPQSDIELLVIQNEASLVKRGPVMGSSSSYIGERGIAVTVQDATALPVVTNIDIVIQTASQAPKVAPRKITTLKDLKRIKRIKRFLKYRNTTSINRMYFYPWDKYQLNINIGTRKLLKMLFHPNAMKATLKKRNSKNTSENASTAHIKKLASLQELLKIYPKIHVRNTTYEEIFKSSPLYFYWQTMNQVTRMFAVRVLQMWNYSGITFDLPEFLTTSNTTKTSASSENIYKYTVVNNSLAALINERFGKFEKIITIGLSSFESLPQGLVTIDDEGLHMETKTTCHAFFGEVLMALKDATRETMPADVIRQTLKVFCKRGAVDNDYCQKLKRV